MQPCRHFAVAVALLLCSIAAATAAGTGPFLVASDELVLTGAQGQLMWQRLVGRNTGGATAPSASTAAVGATVPPPSRCGDRLPPAPDRYRRWSPTRMRPLAKTLWTK